MDPTGYLVQGAVALLVAIGLVVGARIRFGMRKDGDDATADIGLD